jgi:hypothetical protein
VRLAALLLLLVASPAYASSGEDTTATFALRAEAKAAKPLAHSNPGKAFLDATRSLPHVTPRVVWVDSSRTHAWTDAEARSLADTTRARLVRRERDEFFYYNTRYGSPLAYLRPIELLAAHGLTKFEGVRLMDFGYGTVGHLRLLASLGADVVGVEVDPSLRALYSQPGDQGKVGKGTLKLVDGQWPATEEVRDAAGSGFDVILSKNTLKRGYIHPERPANPRMLVQLGVDDSTYVARLHDALKPGGYVLIYNLSPAPSKPDQPYQPWSDGRCPFERSLLERSGFEVLAYDLDDGPAARELAHALGWDAGPRPMDLANDLFAHATLLRRSN